MDTSTYKDKQFSIGEEVGIFTGSLYIPTVPDYRGKILRFLGTDMALVSTEDGPLRFHLDRLHKMEEGELQGVAKPKG